MESRAKCLSISKRNKEADNIIDAYALQWNIPYSQAVFRMAREYNQMLKWDICRIAKEIR